MKKWAKILGKCAAALLLLIIIADVYLYVISRTQWFENRVTQTLQQALGRSVTLGHIGANLRGVFVEDLQIAQPGGFEEGVFVEAGLLRVRVALWRLLRGHIKADHIFLSNTTLYAYANADGTTNWDDLVAADTADTAAEPERVSLPFLITVSRIRLENLRVVYENKYNRQTWDLQKLDVDASHFNLRKEFPLRVYAKLSYQEQTQKREMALSLKTRLNLQKLDLEKATLVIEALRLFYAGGDVSAKGTVENFISPRVQLEGTFKGVSAKLLEDWVALPDFTLEKANLSLKAVLNPQEQTLTVHRFSLQTPGADISANGGLVYQAPLRYELSAQAHLIWGELGKWIPVLATQYQLIGATQGQLKATQDEMSAQISLQEMGGAFDYAGRLANVNGTLSVAGTTDRKTAQAALELAGKLNGNPFEAGLTAQQTAKRIVADLKIAAPELILPKLVQAQPTAQPAPPTPPTAKKAWPLPPVDLTANVQIGKMDIPYFMGQDINFQAKVDGLTPNLDQAHGSLRLQTKQGVIQDIYKLTSANALTKVLFVSLDITGKVFNSLNVFGVLSSLGSGVVSAVKGKEETSAPLKTQTILGPDGTPLEVQVEEQTSDVSGQMEYDKFDTAVNFVHGVAHIEDGSFVSPTASFRLNGTTDFNSGEIDMTVHAAPGRHEVDGMMPLSLKIGGTLDNPQGNMQLLGSVTSLVTQSITNNVVSRQVGKGVKGIFGLFKKADK